MMTGLAQTKKFPRNFKMMSTHQLLNEETDQLMMMVFGQCGWLYPLDASQDNIKIKRKIMIASQENQERIKNQERPEGLYFS